MISRAICCGCILLLLLTSCNNPERNATEGGNLTTKKPGQPVKECYEYNNQKDTVLLSFTCVGDSVTGTLEYSLFEKDKNTGTIQGKINEDILLADYTFMSEGVTSVRQVAFKKEGGIFMEGYGEVEMEADKAIFKNAEALEYNSKVKLVRATCE